MHSNLFILSKQFFFLLDYNSFLRVCFQYSFYIVDYAWEDQWAHGMLSCLLTWIQNHSPEMSNSNCFAKDPHSKLYDHTGECFSYKLNRLMEHVIIIRTAFHSINKVVKRPEFSISERSVWTATMQTGGWCYCFFF